MRSWLIIGALTFGVSGCGGGSNRTTTFNPTQQVAATTSATAHATPAAVSAVLNAALLQLNDLPRGWMPGAAEANSNSAPLCGTTAYDPKLSAGYASATFQQSEKGPFLSQDVFAYAGDEARSFLSAIRNAANSCKDWTEPDGEGGQQTLHVAALSVASFGDEDFAFRLSSDPTILGPLAADIVLIRRGRYVTLIAHLAIGYGGIDSDQTAAFAKQADDKLKTAIGLR